jgi:hypothetical protein
MFVGGDAHLYGYVLNHPLSHTAFTECAKLMKRLPDSDES